MLFKCEVCGKAEIDLNDVFVLRDMLDHTIEEHWHGGVQNHGWSGMFLACWRKAVDYIKDTNHICNKTGLIISTTT
jgi:hypothetical protein